MNIYIARQPVYDRELNVVAYELLYRSGEENSAGFIENPEQASSQVIINAFVEMGIDKLAADLPVLINVTRSFLETNHVPEQMISKVVWEILETENIDESFVERMNQLVKKGFKYALDDFVFDKQWALLLPNAQIIKYDVMALGKEGVDKQLNILNKFKMALGGLDAKLLAEKVETHEEFEYYKSCGFDYFQGYFIAKPKIIKDKAVSSSRMALLSLLAELNNTEVSMDQLVRLFSRDARLTYKILKLVDTAFLVRASKVNTIQQAIMMIGLDQLRCWASLLALSMDDGKPPELLTTAMVRARMCQILAEKLGYEDTNPGFTAGLFSLMDALMDMPLREVVDAMPFSKKMASAIVDHEGDVGHLVSAVVNYEAGHWNESECLSGLSSDILYDAYTESIEWAQLANHSMTS